jgi:hypothetical protein
MARGRALASLTWVVLSTWRYCATSLRAKSGVTYQPYAAHAFEPDIIVNYTIWASLQALKHFTYQSGHGAYFRRRQEWFEPLGKPSNAMWWVPAGEVPSIEEAKRRYDHLLEHGPSSFAFGFRDEVPSPQ